jgi:phosphohistidine phosphatase
VRLYLIRHAKAEEFGPEGDLSRRLTQRGREDARRVAEVLQGRGLRPSALVTSPAVRARETAGILASVLGLAVESDDALAPGAPIEAILEAARSRAGRGDTAVVGHQPDLGRAAAFLLGETSGACLQLRPAAVCGIEVDTLDAPPGRLACLISPDEA